MRINAYNQFYNYRANSFKRNNLQIANDLQIDEKQLTVDKLSSNYALAKKFLEEKSPAPLIDAVMLLDLPQLQQNDKIFSNLLKFIIEDSKQQLINLQNDKNNFTEKKEIEIFLKKFHETFLPYKDLIHPESISFNALKKIIPKQKKDECLMLINAFSLACAGIAVGGALTAGAATAAGIDAWAQRGMQFLMFYLIGKKLNLDLPAFMPFAISQWASKCAVGVTLSQKLVGGVQFLVSTVSGGTLAAPAAGVAAFCNGGLSTGLTEMMGRGFLKDYENGKMTFKDQLIKSGLYFATLGAIDGIDKLVTMHTGFWGFVDTLKSIAVGMSEVGFLTSLLEHTNLGEQFGMLVTSVATDVIYQTKVEKRKLNIKESVKNAIINVVTYDIVSEALPHGSKDEIAASMKEVGEKLKDVPEAYKYVCNARDELANEFGKFFNEKGANARATAVTISMEIKNAVKQIRYAYFKNEEYIKDAKFKFSRIMTLGLASENFRDFQKAEEYYNEAKEAVDTKYTKNLFCIALEKIGDVLIKQNKFEHAINTYNYLIEELLKFNDKEKLSRVYKALGDCYRNCGNIHEAKQYYDKSRGY